MICMQSVSTTMFARLIEAAVLCFSTRMINLSPSFCLFLYSLRVIFSTTPGLWLFLYIKIAAKYARTVECSMLVMFWLSAFCKMSSTSPFTLSFVQNSSGLVALSTYCSPRSTFTICCCFTSFRNVFDLFYNRFITDSHLSLMLWLDVVDKYSIKLIVLNF